LGTRGKGDEKAEGKNAKGPDFEQVHFRGAGNESVFVYALKWEANKISTRYYATLL
jgi:hypothetical protein